VDVYDYMAQPVEGAGEGQEHPRQMRPDVKSFSFGKILDNQVVQRDILRHKGMYLRRLYHGWILRETLKGKSQCR